MTSTEISIPFDFRPLPEVIDTRLILNFFRLLAEFTIIIYYYHQFLLFTNTMARDVQSGNLILVRVFIKRDVSSQEIFRVSRYKINLHAIYEISIISIVNNV